MRIFVSALVVFLLLLSIITGYNLNLAEEERKIFGFTDSLAEATLEKDSEKAETYLEKAENEWTGIRNMLMAFSEHQELNTAEEHLRSVRGYLKFENFEEMYNELSLFNGCIKNTFDSAVPTIMNIL